MPDNVMRIVIGLVVLASLIVVATRITVTSDMGVFLPKNESSTAADVLLSQLDSGATANVVFVRVRGDTPENLAALSRQLVDVWGKSDVVERALNGTQTLTESDIEFVEKYRYLLADIDATTFSADSLSTDLRERVRGLSGAMAALEKRFLRQDPTGEVLGQLQRWQAKRASNKGPRKIDGVWFSQDAQSAILVLQTRTKGMDLDSHEASARYLTTSFDEVSKGAATLDMTGAGAFAVETRDAIRADVRLLTLLATLVIGLFLMVVFRSLRLMLLLFVPLVCGVVVAIAAVLLAFGQIHGITLAFGITLTGVAVDYPIHFFAHLNDSNDSPTHQVRRIWPTLRLGVVTTIVAYAFLLLSNFEGLQQLGLFTIAGLLTAAAVTRWVLPLLVPGGMKVAHRLNRLHELFTAAGTNASRARLPAIICVAVASLFLLLTEKPLRDFQVDVLSPIPLERRLDAKSVRRDLNMWSGGKMLVAVADSEQSALERTESLKPQLDKLVSQGTVSDYDMASQFLPSVRTQLERRATLPETEKLEQDLDAALEGLPFKKGVFEPFVSGVTQSRTLKPLTLADLSERSLASHLKPMLFERDGRWMAPILLHNVVDEKKVAALSGDVTDGELIYIGLKDETSQLMRRVIDRMVTLIAIGTVCIYILLGVAFGDWRRPFRILVPTLASVIVVSAILVASGVAMNLFHLTALLLVLGLGLDYSLFFSRLPENPHEWETTFRSLWVCCLTTVFVFGLLIVSKTPPLHSVGITAAIGASLSLIFGAIWSSAYGQGQGIAGLFPRKNRSLKESTSQ